MIQHSHGLSLILRKDLAPFQLLFIRLGCLRPRRASFTIIHLHETEWKSTKRTLQGFGWGWGGILPQKADPVGLL